VILDVGVESSLDAPDSARGVPRRSVLSKGHSMRRLASMRQ